MLTSAAMRNQNRNDRYIDFDQMEYMPEIASAMDIYADEMTTSNEFNRLVKIECLNDEIKSIIEALFYDALNIEFNAFGWARTMCKYGDFFLYLDIDEEDEELKELKIIYEKCLEKDPLNRPKIKDIIKRPFF